MHNKTILTASLTIAATLLTAAVLLSSCNTNKMLNKAKETLKEREHRKEELDFARSLAISHQGHDLDSGRITDSMVVEIIPVGPFRYSLSDGFEGKALRIALKGTSQHDYLKTSDNEGNIEKDLTLLLNKEDMRERSLQRKSRDKEVQRSMTRPLVLVIALALLLGLSTLLFRK